MLLLSDDVREEEREEHPSARCIDIAVDVASVVVNIQNEN
jgi:hypothetical protein